MLEDELARHDYDHLKVRVYGTLHDGWRESVNLARLTKVTVQTYTLGVANHYGKWGATPYRGTMTERVDLLCSQFGFILAPGSF